jgi:hypothetical protein
MSIVKFEKQNRKEALEKLCDKYGVSHFMGNLFLNEIKLAWHNSDKEQRYAVKYLGLVTQDEFNKLELTLKPEERL